MPSAAAARHSRSPGPGWSAAASRQQCLRVRGQFPHTPREQDLEPVTDGHRLRQRRLPAQLLRGQIACALDDGQGVATGLGDDALRHIRVERAVDRDREQLVCVLLRQAGDPEIRQPLQPGFRLRRLPDREQHPDPIGQQPAGHEAEDVGGLVVQPLRVVDHAQHRPSPGRLREQREHGQTDQERVGRRAAHQSEGHAECPLLRLGQPIHGGQQGYEQLVDSGETQGPLRLDGHHPDDLQVRGALYGVVEQRRLPDSGLTPEDQRAAHTRTHAVEHCLKRQLLRVAVDEPHADDRSPDRPAEKGAEPRACPCAGAVVLGELYGTTN